MSDLEQFQGQWKIIGLEENGRKRPTQEIRDGKIVVARDRYSLYLRGQRFEGIIKGLVSTRRPRPVDFQITAGPDGIGRKFPAIYLLEDGELTICVAPPGKARPANLDPKPGNHCWLYLLNRVEPEIEEQAGAGVGIGNGYR